MIAVLAWTPSQRPHELAAAFGGVAHTPYFPQLGRHRALAPARYALSALLTAAFLARRRPDAVIVQNPPIVPGVIAYIYSKLTGAKLVMDSHPRGFGLKASRAGRLFRPVHARLMRHAAATMVASEPLADEVRRAGGRPLVVHEPPPLWRIDAPPSEAGVPTVLWVGIYATDEPVAEVIGAAHRLPGVRFVLTGDPARCPPDVRAAAPPNVTFSGYRRGDDYRALVADATILMVLTTAPTSVPRGAFEAVAALRPLVLSDQPLLRAQFPEAVFADNSAPALAVAVADALARRAELSAAAPAARDRDAARWAAQRDAVLEALR